MIEVTELRIGNLVYGESQNIEIITAINQSGGVVSKSLSKIPSQVWRIEQVEGIPLTEQILLDCGFEDGSYANFSLKLSERAYLVVSFKDYACSMICQYPEIADHDLNAPCKYLHQLQNLYYALTGEELNYNPK